MLSLHPVSERDVVALRRFETDNRAFFAEQFLITDDNVAEFATPATDAADFECDNVFDRVAGPLS